MSSSFRIGFVIRLVLVVSLLGLVRPQLAHGQVTFSVPPSWTGSTFVADFNKDGFADYIAPSGFVYLGNGDGTFRRGKQVPGAANALGDVNGDGNVDVLQRDFGGPLNGVLYVALGNGDGTFQPRLTNYTLPMLSILAGDLNGDGKADVVGVESPNLNMLLIYLGKGDGTFVAGQTLPLNGSLVTLADFNGDHVPDILLDDSSGVTVLLGNGDGTFQAGKFTSVVTSENPIVTGDFNNDGKLDLVIGNELLLGNGDGTFQSAIGITDCGNGFTAQDAADFNGDGNLDLAISISGTSIGTCLGNGDGTFSANFLYVPTTDNHSVDNPQPPFVIADFNGDGKPDFAGGGFVLLGKGDGTLQGLPAFAPGFSATAGSFNKKGNGAQDVVEVIPNQPESIDVLVNDGKGKLSLGQTIVAAGFPGTGTIAMGDFNGDGYPDAVYVGTDPVSGNWGYAILLGNGDGSFQPPQFLSQNVAGTSFRQYSLVVADFNNDNKMDLAVGPVGDGDLAIMLGNGDGTFSAPSYVFDGGGPNNNPTVLVGADFNGDGKLDIAASPLGTSNPGTAILLGNGDGTFQPATFPLGDFSVLATADFNKDGKADLVGVSKSQGYEVLLGKGDGTFTAQPRFADCSCLAGLTVADMNGDGIPDLFVDYYTFTNQQFEMGNSYSVYLGRGDGTFSPLAATGAKFTSEFTAAFNVIVDLNGDGKPDVVTNLDSTFVLLNNSAPASGTITLAPAPGSPTSAEIAPGAKADFSLLLTPSGFFNASVSFACDVSPKSAHTPTCSVPATVEISGSTAVKVPVTVSAPSGAMGAVAHSNLPLQATSIAWTILVFASISLLAAGHGRRRAVTIPVVTLALISFAACGGGGSGSGGGNGGSSTYTVTVTATMGKSNSNTTLTVTVQ